MDELETLSETSHENVLQAFGWAWARSYNVYATIMEYMCNGTMESLIVRKISLPPLLRYRLCYDVANGIEYLHNLKSPFSTLVHGDITPENILLSDTLQCKIAGFCGAAFSSTSPSYLSSPLYAPPEILHHPLQKKKQTHDVYSYSVIATELIGWERPLPHFLDFYVESIKIGNRPDLSQIEVVKQAFSDGDDNEKAIFEILTQQIRACRKQTVVERATMVEVKNNLAQFWGKCDTSKINDHVQEVLKKFPQGLSSNKKAYSLKSLTEIIPRLKSSVCSGKERIVYALICILTFMENYMIISKLYCRVYRE